MGRFLPLLHRSLHPPGHSLPLAAAAHWTISPTPELASKLVLSTPALCPPWPAGPGEGGPVRQKAEQGCQHRARGPGPWPACDGGTMGSPGPKALDPSG